jgi:hypothetical protein
MTQTLDTGGPLSFPIRPPDTKTMVLITETLKGHATSSKWLPEGSGWPLMDELRTEHLRLRGLVARELEKRAALVAAFAKEDAGREHELRQAFREHRGESPLPTPEDTRTPDGARQAQLAAVEETLWAAVTVLAEHVRFVKRTLAEHEEQWLADLRARMGPAEDEVRRAREAIRQAESRKWGISRMGQWLLTACDANSAFENQPAPSKDEPMPRGLNQRLIEASLERPYYRMSALSKPSSFASRSTTVTQPLGARANHHGDVMLDHGEMPSDLIEPLEPTSVAATTESPGRHRRRGLPRHGKGA